MTEEGRNLLMFGQSGPLPKARPLQAGPITLVYEEGLIRNVMWNGHEVVRRIYAAVRDKEWRTVPGIIRDLKIEEAENSFAVNFISEHNAWGIHFVWRGQIVGDKAGKITFDFDGESKSEFERNRIGFCVLHPPRTVAGEKCEVIFSNGSKGTAVFPEVIAAEQPVSGFSDLTGMTHPVGEDAKVAIQFVGEIFETEDQRNWIDDSFKTYCTPLSRPLPVKVNVGDRVRQTIMVQFTASANAARNDDRKTANELKFGVARSMPLIGFGHAQSGDALTFLETTRLQQLKPAHLRVEVRMHDPDWAKRFAAGLREATELKCKVELALRLTGCAGEDLRDLITTFPEPLQHWSYSGTFTRILVSTYGEPATSKRALEAFRAFLNSSGLGTRDVPVGAGTEFDLYEFNQRRPPREADLFFWSMNPQTHAFDAVSLAETPRGALSQLASMQDYFPDAPKVVSPITLRPRSVMLPGKSEIESQTDPRQKSLFGASWTISMLGAMLAGEARAATFFETTGPLGLMERGEGRVFPIYHVFRAIAGFKQAIELAAGDLSAIAVKSEQSMRILIGNPTTDPIAVNLNFPAAARRLNAETAAHACEQPEAFWNSNGTPVESPLKLAPFEIVFLDVDQPNFPEAF